MADTATGPPGSNDAHTMAVYLEEVAYFLEDMQHDLWWLLQAALQPSGERFVRGDEELEALDPSVTSLIESMQEKANKHYENHEHQVRGKMTIIPQVTQEERELLAALKNLRFHCKGQIDVFRCMAEANNAAIWAAYHNSIATVEPQRLVPTDGMASKSLLARSVFVIPVRVDQAKHEIRALSVFSPGQGRQHWAFAGGDVHRGVDRNIYDTARREFQEEVGVFFGMDWKSAFRAELPADTSQPLDSDSICSYVHLEKDGVRYPCRPYIFALASDEFHALTMQHETSSGVIKLPMPESEHIRWDEQADAKRVLHLQGSLFVEHDEANWLTIDFDTGRLADDRENRQVRKEVSDLLKQRPEKVWDWFSKLLGVEPPVRQATLTCTVNPDGPFAVRMSGIDKTATDEDVMQFFEEAEIKCKGVEQHEIPKHTARVDFFDADSLEKAMQLSGRTLKRRKVKVELWDKEEEAPVDVPGIRALKEYDGPLPDEAPFLCRCRGLDKKITKDDLGYFFWDRDCQVQDVSYPLKSERHAGIVEFVDQDSLKRALGLKGAVFHGREMSIDLASKNDDRKEESNSRGGAGGGGGGDRPRGGGKGGGKGAFSRDRDRDRGDAPSRADFGSDRPKLALKPRTLPVGQGEERDRPQHAPFGGGGAPFGGGGGGGGGGGDRPGRSDPFGGARPRDDRNKGTSKADEDMNWRR
mmetsp:Transcript_19019/g.44370  ORF Transcript_19019/g.44370 Transcript_19019/m.44370 type:complete len:698 (+) Transcript_19019:86-2179(+)